MVARERAVTAADLGAWRDAFLEAGEAGSKTRARDDRDATIGRLRAKLGALTMDAEPLTAKACPRLDRGSTGWRPAAVGPLWHRGRLRDERRRLDLHAPPIRHRPHLPGLGRRALGRPPAAPLRRRVARAEAQAGAAGGDAGRGAGRGDPAGARRQPLPWAEGHRKVWARLRHQGLRTSKERVRRLMRESGLSAATRVGRPRGPRAHDGTIVPERVDAMGDEPSSAIGSRTMANDRTAAFTLEHGQVAVFVAVDHCSAECTGIHAARRGTRHEALEPIRQGVVEHFGGVAEGVAQGLSIRHDHGSQSMSHDFQREIAWLGAASSPALVRAPEGNGCAERFIRTLKENPASSAGQALLWVRTFATLEELRLALLEFRQTYNENWLIERHGHRSPAQFRRDQMDPVPLAA